VIDTPAGRIFHSADFKIDHNPVVGEAWDDARFAEIVAERPVKAMMCDSTNVFSTHEGRSESTLGPALTD
jgi:ribonuclease J